MDEYPELAECHTRSDYVTMERQESRVIPGKMYSVEIYHCIGCDRERPVPQHGRRIRCPCGIHVVAYGNALYVWKEGSDV